MNFFGHAHVARWFRSDSAFVFGAMLPDLARMADTRVSRIEHAPLLDGVRLHHRTDAAFHQTKTFHELCAMVRGDLIGGGVLRPQSLAVAHIGIELLLDGALSSDEPTRQAYRQAMDRADRLVDRVHWAHPDGAQWFSRAMRRLRGRDVPDVYCDPARVGRAVVRILAHRPRLAVDPDHEPVLVHCLTKVAPTVSDRCNTWLSELRDLL